MTVWTVLVLTCSQLIAITLGQDASAAITASISGAPQPPEITSTTPIVTHGETAGTEVKPPGYPQFGEIFMTDLSPKKNPSLPTNGNNVAHSFGTEDLTANLTAAVHPAVTGQTIAGNTADSNTSTDGTVAPVGAANDASSNASGATNVGETNLATSILTAVSNSADKMNLTASQTVSNTSEAQSQIIAATPETPTLAEVTSSSGAEVVTAQATANAVPAEGHANETKVVHSVGTEDILTTSGAVGAETTAVPSVGSLNDPKAVEQPAAANAYGPPPVAAAPHAATSNDANATAAAITVVPGSTVQHSVGTEDLTANVSANNHGSSVNVAAAPVNAVLQAASDVNTNGSGAQGSDSATTGVKSSGFNLATGPVNSALQAATDVVANVSAPQESHSNPDEAKANGVDVATTTVNSAVNASSDVAHNVSDAQSTAIGTKSNGVNIATASVNAVLTAASDVATNVTSVQSSGGIDTTVGAESVVTLASAIGSDTTTAVETSTAFFAGVTPVNETGIVHSIGTDNIVPPIANASAVTEATANLQSDNLTLSVGKNDNNPVNNVGILPGSQKETSSCAPMLQQFIQCAKEEVISRTAGEKQEADGVINQNIQKCFTEQSCTPPDFLSATDYDLEGTAKAVWHNLSTWWDQQDTDKRECVVRVFRGSFRERLQDCVRQNLSGFSIAITWGENKLSPADKAELKRKTEHRFKTDVAIHKCVGKRHLVESCIAKVRKSTFDKLPCEVRNKCAAGVTDPNCKTMWVSRFRNPICECRREVINDLLRPTGVQQDIDSLVSVTCPGVTLPEIDVTALQKDAELSRRVRSYIALHENRDISICDECEGVDFKKL